MANTAKALYVFTTNPRIRAWLLEHDPKALAQAELALQDEAADHLLDVQRREAVNELIDILWNHRDSGVDQSCEDTIEMFAAILEPFIKKN